MKGFIHLIVPKEQFELLDGEEQIQSYRFNTGLAVHKFCKLCGIHAFYQPRSHPDSVDINAHCIKDFNLNDYPLVDFDGQNWEDNIDLITD